MANRDTPGRRPDYNLNALDKNTEQKGRVGAAWLNDDGTIRVKINPWVVLTGGDSLVLTLFPSGEPRPASPNPKPNPPDGGGDIPF